jgi:hypothetical protein
MNRKEGKSELHQNGVVQTFFYKTSEARSLSAALELGNNGG